MKEVVMKLKSNYWRIFSIFSLSLLALATAILLTGDRPQAGNSSAPSLKGEAAVQHLKRSGLYDSLQDAFTAARYQIREQPSSSLTQHRSYTAQNPNNRYSAFFEPDQMRIAMQRPNKADREETGMKLKALGYGEQLLSVVAGAITTDGNRIQIRREVWSRESGVASQITRYPDSGLQTPDSRFVEWYINKPAGLEQGFTLNAPPEAKGAGEQLRIEMEVTGDLRAELMPDAKSVALKRRDDSIALRYEGLVAFDAAGRDLPARMKAKGNRVWLEVDDEGAIYPLTIDPMFVQVQKLTPNFSDADDNNDRVGRSVAIEGNLAVVGAPGDGPLDQGLAYAFLLDNGVWTNNGVLSSGISEDFGFSVSISGNTVVVGDPDATFSGGDPNKGGAFVFVGPGPVWGLQQSIEINNSTGDRFGESVAVDGDRLVVGAPGFNFLGIDDTGQAFVFTRSGSTWALTQVLGFSVSANNAIGQSVDISGDTLVISSAGNFDSSLPGSALVFIFSGGSWGLEQQLVPSDSAAGDHFASGVALDGNTIAATADGGGYVFTRSGTTWSEQQKLTLSGSDLDGLRVALDQDTVVIGAPFTDGIKGKAFVFTRSGTTWTQSQTLTADDGTSFDFFGLSVAIDGNKIIIGAPEAGPGTAGPGAAYIFEASCAPTLSCPVNITTNTAPNQCSAVVNYSLPTVGGDCQNPDTPICTPPSGSVFSKGATQVNCSVSDSSGATANCSFTVTVSDTQAPQITCPASITMNTAAGQCSKAVAYNSPSVSDNCPGPFTTNCNPASGSTFNLGTTQVNCSVTDASGNQASCQFNVTILDAQPPNIICPANITINAEPGLCSAVVNFPLPEASDNCAALNDIECAPQPGSPFPVGTTTVGCAVKDPAGNSNSCAFTIKVIDNQPPQIICPPDQNVSIAQSICSSSGQSGVVNYQLPSVTDNCSGVTVTCTPPSGSVFSAGTTTVTCKAKDGSSNKATCSFTVTAFDVCLQDNSSPSKSILFVATGSQKGKYAFCCNGTVLTGTGTVKKQGCVYTLEHNPMDRRVMAKVDKATLKGNASLQYPAGVMLCTIIDTNITNSVSSCP